MTAQEAELVVPAPVADVRRVLLDPLALPSWNEAFLAVTGPSDPVVGQAYALRVRPGFTGTLAYDAIEPDRIEISWQVPGFHENGSWTLIPHGSSTVVRHTFTHSGPLAAALRPAYRGVAALRLTRLTTRLTTRLS